MEVDPRDKRAAIVIGSVIAVLIAAAGIGALIGLFDDQGTKIAKDIAAQHDARIQDMEYPGDHDASGPELTVIVKAGVTSEDAVALTCDVLLPAIQRGNQPDSFSMVVLDSTGSQLMASDETECS